MTTTSAIRLERLYVVGVVRNVESTLRTELLRIHNLFSKDFVAIEIFLVESDSNDNTLNIMRNLASELEGFEYVSLGNLESQIPNRIERLGFCRNRYVQYLRTKTIHKNSLVLALDLDIRNSRLDADGVQAALDAINTWDAVFANQAGRYFDIYALRHKTWNSVNCFDYEGYLRASGLQNSRKIAIWSKMVNIPKNTREINVQSAFGGMGLYRLDCFLTSDYTPRSKLESQLCEHVVLHNKLIERGARLCILPSFVNFGWSPHNLSSFLIFRIFDKWTKATIFLPFRRAIRRTLG